MDAYFIHFIAEALDVALGLEHLHNREPSIVHGDLKGVSVAFILMRAICLSVISRSIFLLRYRDGLAWLISALQVRSIQKQ